MNITTKAQAKAYMDGKPYVPARDQFGYRGATTLWVVLHSMEAPEVPTTAEGCANYFRNPPRTASTQWCVDVDSTIRTADNDQSVAGARGANHTGVHIEQAGYAAQTASEWTDAYSRRMVVEQTAPLVAALCVWYGLPPRWCSEADVRAGRPGITDHETLWRVFGGDVRSDPGDHYPRQLLLDTVNQIITPEDEMNEADFDRIRTICREEARLAVEDAIAATNAAVHTVNDATGSALTVHLGNPVTGLPARKLMERVFNGVAAVAIKADADSVLEDGKLPAVPKAMA